MTSIFVFVSMFAVFSHLSARTDGARTAINNAERISLRRQEIEELLGAVRGGSNFIPMESKKYKCQILNEIYKNARLKYPDLPKKILNPRMIDMLDNCKDRDFRAADFFSEPFIFPGTLWCGPGNIAENFNHLGMFNETDACCRTHDYCNDIIRPGRTKHNLINPYGTTRLHCRCDEALRKCFRDVNSVVSNTVGYIFFSLLQTQCFDFDYPTSGCLLWRRGAVRLYCVKYELDEEKPKQWQWFDQEPYM